VLVLDVSRKHTHTKAGASTGRRALKAGADAKYRKHTRPYNALHIAFLPVIADTAGYLHEDAVRLLYHAATVKASGNVDNEGLIGRERDDPRFGFRRVAIFRRHRADLGPLLAALGGTVPIASPSPIQDRGSREGKVVTVASRYTIKQRMNSNKRYTYIDY
jgi:hypothetical protein